MFPCRTLPFLSALVACLTGLTADTAQAQAIQTWRLGPDTDTPASPLGGIVMSGGAGEVDPAMQWFLERAGGGDVLILRVSGSDGYQDYFYEELGVDVASVETIKFTAPSAASADYVVQRIAEAEAVWLAGGDQGDYVNYWQGTPVEDGLHALVARGGVIGGISAGMAVLGGGYFAAGNGTVYSDEALANPYDDRVDVRHGDFLELPFLSEHHHRHPLRRSRPPRPAVDLPRPALGGPRRPASARHRLRGIHRHRHPTRRPRPGLGRMARLRRLRLFRAARLHRTHERKWSRPRPLRRWTTASWGLSPAAAGDADGQGGLVAGQADRRLQRPRRV